MEDPAFMRTTVWLLREKLEQAAEDVSFESFLFLLKATHFLSHSPLSHPALHLLFHCPLDAKPEPVHCRFVDPQPLSKRAFAPHHAQLHDKAALGSSLKTHALFQSNRGTMEVLPSARFFRAARFGGLQFAFHCIPVSKIMNLHSPFEPQHCKHATKSMQLKHAFTLHPSSACLCFHTTIMCHTTCRIPSDAKAHVEPIVHSPPSVKQISDTCHNSRATVLSLLNNIAISCRLKQNVSTNCQRPRHTRTIPIILPNPASGKCHRKSSDQAILIVSSDIVHQAHHC